MTLQFPLQEQLRLQLARGEIVYPIRHVGFFPLDGSDQEIFLENRPGQRFEVPEFSNGILKYTVVGYDYSSSKRGGDGRIEQSEGTLKYYRDLNGCHILDNTTTSPNVTIVNPSAPSGNPEGTFRVLIDTISFETIWVVDWYHINIVSGVSLERFASNLYNGRQ